MTVVPMRRAFAIVAAMLVACTAGCGSHEPAEDSRPPVLREVALPDLSAMAESVRTQIGERHAALTALAADRATPAKPLGDTYGEVGNLLMAAGHHPSAEPYFLNAEMLLPGDVRWPYLLGHVYKATGDLEKSARAFERALRLSPNDAATLLWLGETRLDQDRPADAAPLFERARSLQPRLAAAHYGLGRAALAREDYREAVARLEEALALEPQATIVHYPLALAYRGLGDAPRAETHLRLRGETRPPLPDPLITAQAQVLNSAQSYETRALVALRAGDVEGAEANLHKAIELAPDDPSPRHGLGAARMALGDHRGALREFEAALKLSPEFAGAHYSLGLLMASAGRDREAITHLNAAVRFRPDDAQTHLLLGDLLRRDGRIKESLVAYQKALAINPRFSPARFGYAIALVRLGRDREAAGSLAEGMTLHPGEPGFAIALARVLSTAPDAQVRDGMRAISITTRLADARSGDSIEVGETMAMARAEVGNYEEAARIQRSLIATLERGGQADQARRMRENLTRYDRQLPCRVPWPADHPIHFPGPAVNAAFASALPSPSGS